MSTVHSHPQSVSACDPATLITVVDGAAMMKQQLSRDLAILAEVEGDVRLVRVQWPSVEGSLVPPEAIPRWLQERRLIWRCLCPQGDQCGRRVARFVRGASGDVTVVCGQFPEGCAFEVDLGRVLRTTILPSSAYEHYVEGQSERQYMDAMDRVGGLEEDEAQHAQLPLFVGYGGDYSRALRQTDYVVMGSGDF